MTCHSHEDLQLLPDQLEHFYPFSLHAFPFIKRRNKLHGYWRCDPKLILPVFVGNDASLHLLVVLADANGEPGAQFAVVEGVHHAKHLALVEAQAIRRLFLIFKMRPDVKGVAHVWLHDPPIHWREAKDIRATLKQLHHWSLFLFLNVLIQLLL